MEGLLLIATATLEAAQMPVGVPLPAPESEVTLKDVEHHHLAHAPCVNPLIVCSFADDGYLIAGSAVALHPSSHVHFAGQTNSWPPIKVRYFHRRCPQLVRASGAPTKYTDMRPRASVPLPRNKGSSKR